MNITVGRHHLPQDLLVEVLLRLPVKSLVRFKCVCKHWYALITSPTFIEKHFRHEHNHARLLICNLTLTQESKGMAFSFLPHKIVPGVSPEQETVHQPWKATNFYAIEGPVHGLFLVHLAMIFDEYDILTLWNPATREFWRLPPVSFELPPYEEYDDKLALGFDPLTQDYKVLWIRMYWKDGGKSCFVNVYSLRNNSWKNLRADFPYLCNLQDAIGSTYLNGVYYQHFWRQDESFGICSFDMGSEQFGELQGPDIPKGQWEKLMLRGDSLAMLVTADGPFNPMTAIYDVWVMNQEGSWTKALRFQPQIVAYLPLNVSEDDKMILEIIEKETSQLVLYDPTIGQVIDLGFQIDLNLGCFWVFNYRESLVQIKRINDRARIMLSSKLNNLSSSGSWLVT